MKLQFKNIISVLRNKESKQKEKAYIFLFCLLLAVFFWFLTALSKEYTTVVDVPVEYTTYSEKFILTERPIETISVEVKGIGFNLLGQQVSLNKEPIKFDLETAKSKSKGTYFIETNKIRNTISKQLKSSLNLLHVYPDSILFKSEPRVKKLLPIALREKLTYKVGYRPTNAPIVEPEKLMVSGPKSVMDTLTKLFTEELELENVSDTTKVELPLLSEYGKVENLKIQKESVTVKLIAEKFSEKIIRLPINITNKAKDYKIKTFPNEVELKLLLPLSRYDEINESEIIASCIFTVEKLNSKKLKVELKNVPDYAEIVRLKPSRVEFIIRK